MNNPRHLITSQVVHDLARSVKEDQFLVSEDIRLKFSQGVLIKQIATQDQLINTKENTKAKTENIIQSWIYGNDAVAYLSNYFRAGTDSHDPTEYGIKYRLELVYREAYQAVTLDNGKVINRKITIAHEKESVVSGKVVAFGFKASSGNNLPVFSHEISEVNTLSACRSIDPNLVQGYRLSLDDRLKVMGDIRSKEVDRLNAKRDKRYHVKGKISKLPSEFRKRKVKSKRSWGTSTATPQSLNLGQNAIDSSRYKEGRFELSKSGSIVYYLPDKGYCSIAGIVVNRSEGMTLIPANNSATDLYFAALKFIGCSIDLFNESKTTTLETTRFNTKGIHREVVSYIPSSKRLDGSSEFHLGIRDRLTAHVPFVYKPLDIVVNAHIVKLNKMRLSLELENKARLAGNLNLVSKGKGIVKDKPIRDLSTSIRLTVRPNGDIHTLESSGMHYKLKDGYDLAISLLMGGHVSRDPSFIERSERLSLSLREATEILKSAIDTAKLSDQPVKVSLLEIVEPSNNKLKSIRLEVVKVNR